MGRWLKTSTKLLLLKLEPRSINSLRATFTCLIVKRGSENGRVLSIEDQCYANSFTIQCQLIYNRA